MSHTANTDDPIPLLTSTFLTKLVSISLVSSSKPTARDEAALPQLYAYLSTLTQNQDNGLQDIGVRELSALLLTARSREIFWKERTKTVEPLIEILRAATGGKDSSSSTLAGSSRAIEPGLSGGVGLQLLYRVLLVLWQLSFQGALVGEGLQAYVNSFPRLNPRILILTNTVIMKSSNSILISCVSPRRKRPPGSSLRLCTTSSPLTAPLYSRSPYSSDFLPS